MVGMISLRDFLAAAIHGDHDSLDFSRSTHDDSWLNDVQQGVLAQHHKSVKTSTKRTASSTSATSFLEKLAIDKTNCLRDYAMQICPFKWLVGRDGDSCRAFDGYRGPCESILHGMSQLSSKQKQKIAKDCDVEWPCKGLYDAEGPYEDPGALFGTNPEAKQTMQNRLQHFLKPAVKCKYQHFVNFWPKFLSDLEQNPLDPKHANQAGDDFSFDSFPRFGNPTECEKQCNLQSEQNCVFYSHIPLSFPQPLGGRCLMFGKRTKFVQDHLTQKADNVHEIGHVSNKEHEPDNNSVDYGEVTRNPTNKNTQPYI